MSAEQFRAWMNAMRFSGRAAADALGIHPNTVTRLKREGGTKTTLLACLAIYHRVDRPVPF